MPPVKAGQTGPESAGRDGLIAAMRPGGDVMFGGSSVSWISMNDLEGLEGRCVRLKTGGIAFFVSERLATTSLSCVPGTWRSQPEVTLADGSREIAARVVADSCAKGI